MSKVATPIHKIKCQLVALYSLLLVSFPCRPDVISRPQGVLYDTCSIHFNIPIRVLTCG